MTLTTHHLQIELRATTPVQLDAQSGAAIRGALTTALWERFCTNRAAPTCAACPLVRLCPVAALVAPLREDAQKGGDQCPRPYVIRPPTSGAQRYAAGESLRFGLGLFGSAAALFPYLVLAAPALEQGGLGRRLPELGGARGLVQVAHMRALQPLSGEQQTLYTAGQPLVQQPGLPISPDDVAAYAATLPTDRITLQLQTPLRLIEQDHLLKRIALRPLLQRLMRRLDDLAIAYGAGPLSMDFRGLLAHTDSIQVADDHTRWVDVVSYSSRRAQRTPIGGLVGHVTFVGDLAPLRELLVWGSLIHCGKNAVKGNGWYTLATLP